MMKTVALSLLLLLSTPVETPAQLVTLTMIDGRRVSVPRTALLGFASSDAENAVTRLVKAAGLAANFKVIPSTDGTVTNAAAMVDESGSTRYIVYSPHFFEAMSAGGRGAWAATGVLAHEIGHHLNAHTMQRGQLTPEIARRQELEADEFAGVELARLGATEDEALAMLSGLSDVESLSHPGRPARVVAVSRGWCAASRPVSNFASAAAASPCGGGAAPRPAVAPSRFRLDMDLTRGAAAPLSFAETETNNVSYKYAFGAYAHVQKRPTDQLILTTLIHWLPNPFEIDATGFIETGNGVSPMWGIGFGADSAGQSGYIFGVCACGAYYLLRMDPAAGGWVPVIMATLASEIREGPRARNTVGVRVNGSVLTLMINGAIVRTIDVGVAPVGRMMLFNDPQRDVFTTAVFLNLHATAGP